MLVFAVAVVPKPRHTRREAGWGQFRLGLGNVTSLSRPGFTDTGGLLVFYPPPETLHFLVHTEFSETLRSIRQPMSPSVL